MNLVALCFLQQTNQITNKYTLDLRTFGPQFTRPASRAAAVEAVGRRQASIDICCPRRRSAANLPHVAAAVDRRDRQTDRRTDTRPCRDACRILRARCSKAETRAVDSNVGWRRGVVVSGVRRMNEVNARRARLVPGWVTVFERYTSSVCNQTTRSTQSCIPRGSLNRVGYQLRLG